MKTNQENIFLFASLFLCACVGCSVAKVSVLSFHHTLMQGAYKNAKDIAQGEIGMRNNPRDLLWNLQAGSVERLLKQYASSNAYFEHAEDSFRYYDQRFLGERSVHGLQGIFFNDSALPYTGKVHDRVMVNTYKALNYAILGDARSARVEFNRALYRQNQAKLFFSEQAAKLKVRSSVEESRSGFRSKDIEATLDNPELERVINERYQNLNDFAVYSRYVNPFATYIAGLFFWLQGDTAKAVDILKEAHGLNQEHTIIAEDFARAARGDAPENELWVVYENGLAPRLEEMRIDIPFIFSDLPIKYAGIAFPKLTSGEEAYPFLLIAAGAGEAVRTEPLVNMGSSIVAEFREELPAVITREVSRFILKTYFQYKLQQNYGDLGGVAGGLYQAATTAVDMRSWTALPYNFQLAHLPIPAGRRLTIRAPEGEPIEINIPSECKNVILYVRIVAKDVAPVYDLIKF